MERRVLAMEDAKLINVNVRVCGMANTVNTKMLVEVMRTVINTASALTCKALLHLLISVSVRLAGMDQHATKVRNSANVFVCCFSPFF